MGQVSILAGWVLSATPDGPHGPLRECFQTHKLVWIARNSHIGFGALVDISFCLPGTERTLELSSSSFLAVHVVDFVSKTEPYQAALPSIAFD